MGLNFGAAPFLKPFIAIALVFLTIEAFKTFGSIFVLTGGGPGTSTSLINLDLYRIAAWSKG